jgi:cyanophycin synthetase
VVTDLDGAQALAAFDIRESDQMVKVLRTQVDVVLSDGVAVLNADDERVAELAGLCDGEVILYGLDAAAPALQAQRAQGGRAVFLRNGRAVLATGGVETLGPEFTRGRMAEVPPETMLAAIAAAWALGIAPELAAAGIETFQIELKTTT